TWPCLLSVASGAKRTLTERRLQKRDEETPPPSAGYFFAGFFNGQDYFLVPLRMKGEGDRGLWGTTARVYDPSPRRGRGVRLARAAGGNAGNRISKQQTRRVWTPRVVRSVPPSLVRSGWDSFRGEIRGGTQHGRRDSMSPAAVVGPNALGGFKKGRPNHRGR